METTGKISKYFTLNNGMTIPAVGLGTCLLKDKDAIVNAIVNCGYRHIDTAEHYFNEDIVGDAIKESLNKHGIKRDDLFITTKMWVTQTNDISLAVTQSLEKLKLDYLDCMLIHWPINYFSTKRPIHEIW